MKKVLFVIQSLSGGGAEKSLVNLLNTLSPDKYCIDLQLFRKEGLFLSQVPSYVNILPIPDAFQHLYAPLNKMGHYAPVKLLGTACARIAEKSFNAQCAFRWKHFYSAIVEPLPNEYDVAIAYVSVEVLYYIDEKVDAKKKMVFIHNDYRTAQHPKKYDLPHFENMDCIVTISEICANILKEEFPQYQAKIKYVPNLTSSALIRNRAIEFFPQEYTNQGYTLLSIGRLTQQKGFDIAVQAAAHLKKKGCQFMWFVIGIGEQLHELKKAVAREKIEDCFFFIGQKENPYPYIEHCDVFVQPSRYEGKSVALDEAKILAKPIVVTDYPTAKDQITDGIDGIIAKLEPEDLADKLYGLLTNEEKRHELSAYLSANEYGNQAEIDKYYTLLD